MAIDPPEVRQGPFRYKADAWGSNDPIGCTRCPRRVGTRTGIVFVIEFQPVCAACWAEFIASGRMSDQVERLEGKTG
jgi:hypothetical protein